jgi:hypothetical protein
MARSSPSSDAAMCAAWASSTWPSARSITPSTWLATAMIRFSPTLSGVYRSTSLMRIERFSQSNSTSASSGLWRVTQSVERWNSRVSLMNGLSGSGAFLKVSATPEGSTIDQYSLTISPCRASKAALVWR